MPSAGRSVIRLVHRPRELTRLRCGRRTRPRSVLLAVALVLAACGGDDPTGSDDPTATPQTPADAMPDAASAEPASITVGATEYAFTLPDDIPAGTVRITLDNVGGTHHNASLVRIPEGKLGAVEAGDVGEVVTASTALGGPATTAPGASSPPVGAVLEPGTYAFLCWFEDADGTPHVERGMMQAFEVTGEAARAQDPPGGRDATFVLGNYFIEPPSDFDGSGSFTVDNQGDIEHELAIIAVPEGTEEPDVATYLEDECRTTQCAPRGGVAGLRFRKQATVDLDLDAGTYVLACFVPEAGADGEPAIGQPPHWKSGMWELVEVT